MSNQRKRQVTTDELDRISRETVFTCPKAVQMREHVFFEGVYAEKNGWTQEILSIAIK